MDNNNFTNERIMAIIRLVCTLIASVAAGFGLALDADALYTGVACGAAFVCFIWSWWKNANLTDAAIQAQHYLDSIKRDTKAGE